MRDINDKVQNLPVFDLFKAEPPVQSVHESLGAFAYRALRDAIRAGRRSPQREDGMARGVLDRTPDMPGCDHKRGPRSSLRPPRSTKRGRGLHAARGCHEALRC